MNTANENTNTIASKFQFHTGKHFQVFLKGLLFIFLAGFIYTWVSSPMITTVTGSGEMGVPADSALISFTLTSINLDATSAIAGAKSKADAVSNMLVVNWGVMKKDIFESQVSVLPLESGFQAAITLGLKTAQVPRVSDLVASLYLNGAAYVSQPVLSIEDIDTYEDQVFQEALKDAKTKARKLSFRNLKFIKKIVSIDQSASGSTSTLSSNLDDTSVAEGDGFAIQTGIMTIQKAVAVTYMMW